MKFNRRFLIILIALTVLASLGGYSAYARGYLPISQVAPTPVIQSAQVRTGDLVILTTASGNVLAATDTALSFRASGLLTELNVAVGDKVQAGQVLARLDETAARLQYEQAKISLEALLSPTAIYEAEITTANALKALETATDRLEYVIGPDVVAAEDVLAQAQADLEKAEADLKTGAGSQSAVDEAKTTVEQAEEDLVDAQEYYATLYVAPQEDIDLARANQQLAKRKLLEAQAYVALLKQDNFTDEELNILQGSAVDRLKQARLALQTAQYALDNTVLTAPSPGIVTKVNANVGQFVGTTPLLVISNLEQPMVRFFVEESDLDRVKIGLPIEVTFEGYAEKALAGVVTSLEPAMGMQDGTPVMLAWATLTPDPSVPLYAGMTANVEIISGEARNTLLAPVAALRELSPGEYAVFAVQPDGTLKLTPVKVGLKDFTNAEILEGLKAGDVVSTGSVATK